MLIFDQKILDIAIALPCSRTPCLYPICPTNTIITAKNIGGNGEVMFKKWMLLRFHCPLVKYLSLIGVWVRSSNVYRCGKVLSES